MPTIVSDIHFHNWSAYSKQVEGMNSRLLDTIKATRQAFDFALNHDKVVLFGGDLVHTRGSLIPSVFNQIVKLWQEYEQKGLKFYMIAGNHDSENIDAAKSKTALDSLESEGCRVVSQGSYCFELPGYKVWAYAWVDDLDTLQETLIRDNEKYDKKDVVLIHAAVGGFVPNISKTLDPEFLYGLNCGYVFAGHIHKHGCYKNKVFSIGSLTQQNFGDMGKKCGFIYLGAGGVIQHFEAKAPHFIDLNNIKKLDNSLLFANEVKNSFVRLTLENVSEEHKQKLEKELKSMKPLELDIRYTPKMVSARKEILAEPKLSGVEVMVKYIDKQPFGHKEETKQAALKILEEVRGSNE